jgi:hypothetical protein
LGGVGGGGAAEDFEVPAGGADEPGGEGQQRGLAGAVGADDADLRAGEERHRDVVEDYLVADGFTGADHRIDVFSHNLSSLRAGRTRP